MGEHDELCPLALQNVQMIYYLVGTGLYIEGARMMRISLFLHTLCVFWSRVKRASERFDLVGSSF